MDKYTVYGLNDCEELKGLIRDNPDLPIVFLVGEDANDGHSYTFAEIESVGIGEVLDTYLRWTDYIYTDRDEFEEDLRYWLDDGSETGPELESRVKWYKEEYSSYWKDAILVYINN